MYAVITSGGKQYRVTEGQKLRVEKLALDVGATVDFADVLMVGNGETIKVGSPFLKGSKVTASVVAQGRGEKIKIVKFRRRKHHRKQMGHRQYFTEVKITSIKA